MKNKRNVSLFTLFVLIASLSSCQQFKADDSSENSQSESSQISPTTSFKIGEDYHKLDGVEEDVVNGFYDGFNKLQSKNWLVAKGYWGVNNGGVSPENVSITEDGVLALGGNGLYYAKNEIESFGAFKDGRKCGASLISTFKALPGHYEIKMKVHPRIGACTAFWTYGNRAVEGEENENAEIDIELPGGSKSGNITFKKSLYTNWITEKASDSIEKDISEVNPNATYSAYNDNEWHTFGFDWYTDPELVVYYVDGKISNVSDTFVPTLAGRLWVGVWFPNGFTGTAEFERDYMYVDYIKYNPFKDQPYVDYDAVPTSSLSFASESFYSQAPVKTPVANKISNGDFEYAANFGESEFDSLLQAKGWSFTKTVSEKQAQKEVCWVEKGAFDDGYSAFVKDNGVLRQNIDAVYDNYSFDYSFKAKTSASGQSGSLSYIFYGSNTSSELSRETITIDNATVKTYTGKITAPKGTEKIRIEARSSKGSKIYLDDLKLTRN